MKSKPSKHFSIPLSLCQLKTQTKVKPLDYEMNTLSTEYNGFPKILIWYYRVIGITFGGIQVKGNTEFVANKWLRYYSYLSIIAYSVVTSMFINKRLHDQDHLTILENGLHFTYYLTGSFAILDIIQYIANQLFLTSNGIQMIKIIAEYGLGLKQVFCF